MPQRFVVKGSRGGGLGQIAPEFFDTEDAALDRACQLLDQYGHTIVVDIWLEGSGQPLRDMIWVSERCRDRRPAQPPN